MGWGGDGYPLLQSDAPFPPCEAPHSPLGLGKLLAAFSVTEFSVPECVSLSDPHGAPGNPTEGPASKGMLT